MAKNIQIANKLVGEGQPCFVIAEVGSNHNNSLHDAMRMIEVAAECGCDAVKFQIFSANRLYQKINPAYSIIKSNELPREWLPKLVAHCEKNGILFSASPFDIDAVDRMIDVGAKFIKIASPEIHDIPLLRHAAKKQVPLILSTGMATISDIYHALKVIKDAGCDDIILLHCVSLYPTKPEFMNLRMIKGLQNSFGELVGLSDHSLSTVIPAAAVAMGACVVEKHFTLSCKQQGPDHSYALEPYALKSMVKGIREVGISLGSCLKEPIYEAEDLGLNNKALVSKCFIPKGSKIDERMLTVKRARQGIRPLLSDAVIGRIALIDIEEDQVITWEML